MIAMYTSDSCSILLQATMQAVRLSLRMRISIGSANSWINIQPSGSTLSVDSLSSANDDSLSLADKVVCLLSYASY